MPETSQTIDDNTLFILLFLKENNEIDIPNENSIYDYMVNYTNTVIMQYIKGKNNLENLSNAGIEYIVENFGIAKNETATGTTLHAPHTRHINDFLDRYLNKFPQDSKYYYDEAKHKKALYQFIKSETEDIESFNGKYFTYKYLPETNKQKYKMIEYIAKLIQKGIFVSDSQTFGFDYDEETLKKIIYLRPSNSLYFKNFFKDFLNEEERIEVSQKLLKRKCEAESDDWIIYNVNAEHNLYHKPSKRCGKIPRRYHQLLYFALEKGKNTVVTPEEYRKHTKDRLKIPIIKSYFSELEKEIEKNLGIKRPKIFISQGKNKWEIKV